MTARKLTEDEYNVYAGSAALAIELVPSFRAAVALLRPFADFDSECVYVDRYARICLSEAFFKRDRIKRATTVLHETLHVLNQHFARGDSIGASGQNFLIAADFEIGTTLNLHPKTDTSHQIAPDKDPFSYPPNKTFEQYYQLLKEDASEDDSGEGNEPGEGDPSGETGGEAPGEPGDEAEGEGAGGGQGDGESDDESSASGAGSGDGNETCKIPSESDMEAADAAGIERASDAETQVSRSNTEAAIAEERKKRNFGSSPLGAFLGRVDLLIQPPKANWRKIFRSVVSRSREAIARGRTDTTLRRPNRRLSGLGDFVFPGMQAYKVTQAMGLDTSGSMGKSDISKSLSEAEGILKALGGREKLRIFTIDTEIAGGLQTVNSVQDVVFKGGGGTDMSPAIKFVRTMKKDVRPDIFVLATDGGVPWPPVVEELRLSRKLFKSIFLITDESAFQAVPDDVRSLATVIDISG